MKNFILLLCMYFFTNHILYAEALFLKNDNKSDNLTRFIFIRHGRTVWNDHGLIQGHSDVPLNEKGHKQAAKVASRLSDEEPLIDAIYSSDLQRAIATAEAITKYYDLELALDPRLRETFAGESEGMPEEEFPKVYASREDVPYAESAHAVLNRTESFLFEMAKKWKGKTIVIVSHGDLIKTLIRRYHVEGTYKIPNCSIIRFNFDHTQNRLVFERISPYQD